MRRCLIACHALLIWVERPGITFLSRCHVGETCGGVVGNSRGSVSLVFWPVDAAGGCGWWSASDSLSLEA